MLAFEYEEEMNWFSFCCEKKNSEWNSIFLTELNRIHSTISRMENPILFPLFTSTRFFSRVNNISGLSTIINVKVRTAPKFIRLPRITPEGHDAHTGQKLNVKIYCDVLFYLAGIFPAPIRFGKFVYFQHEQDIWCCLWSESKEPKIHFHLHGHFCFRFFVIVSNLNLTFSRLSLSLSV